MRTYILFGLLLIISGFYLLQGLDSTNLLLLRVNIWLQMVCAAFVFASAGAVLQILLHNPLADPWLLGVSGASGVGVVIASLLTPLLLIRTLFSLAGALLIILLLFLYAARKQKFCLEPFILMGIGVNALCSALILFLQSIFAPNDFFASLARMSGHITVRSLPEQMLLILAFVIMAVFLNIRRKEFAVLRSGEFLAQTIGVPVDRIKFEGVLTSSVALALAVSIVGSIGFVGLAASHLVRMFLGEKYVLRPEALFSISAILMISAALLIRMLPVGSFVPLGTAMALIGAPIFIMILFQKN